MTQLTIRMPEEDLSRRIAEVAKDRGWSLNRAALHLLRRGAGMGEEPRPSGIDEALDAYVGVWTAAEAAAFDRRVSTAFEGVDEEMWRP